MKITTENLPNCQVALTIQPDEAVVEAAARRAAQRISRQYNVPGFRRGKAPMSAVIRAYGKEVLYEQVAEDLSDEVYRQALDETGLQPIAPGTLDDVTFEPLVFKLTLSMPAKVELGDYRSIRLDRPPVEVTDEEVNQRLEEMQRQQSEWAPLEGEPAQMGDLVSLRLKGAIGDQTIIDEEDFELVLEPKNEDFPPDFDQQFVGRPAGTSLSFDLTYPEDWPSDRAGKQAHFEAGIVGVKRQEVPPLDDTFAALIGEYETLEELKSSIRESIYAARKVDADMQFANQAVDKLIEGAQIEFPPVLLERSLDRIVSEQERNLEQAGLPMSEYLRITRQTKAQFRQQFLALADKRLRGDLVIDALIQAEHLQATDEEIEAEISRLLASSSESAPEMRSFLTSDVGRLMIAEDVARQKALNLLVDMADGKVPEPAAVETTSEPQAEDDMPEPAAQTELESATVE